MRLVMSTIDASTFDATSSVDSGLLPEVPPGEVGRGADEVVGGAIGRWEMPTGTPIAAPSAMPTIAAMSGVSRRDPVPAGGGTGCVGPGWAASSSSASGPASTSAWACGSAQRWSSQRPSQMSSPGRGKWSDKTGAPDQSSSAGKCGEREADTGEPCGHLVLVHDVADGSTDLVVDRVQLVRTLRSE